MNPKVSIIVPVYNVERFIHECVDSLLNQTLKEIEIILVDDESPDNCPRICDEYAQLDSRIKVVHKKNGGLGYARNSGMEVAQGEFVGFIDSDDYIDSTMYEKLYNKAMNNGLDTVYSAGFTRVSESNKTDIRKETDTYIEFEQEDIMHTFLPEMIGAPPQHHSDVKYTMSACRAIYSLDQINKYNIRFESERVVYSEDLIFNMDYLQYSNKIGMIPECFYYYRYNEKSLTNSYNKNRYNKTIDLYQTILDRVEKLNIYQYCSLNLDRFYLCMSRGLIASEINANKDKKKRAENLNLLYNNAILKRIVKTYPYKRLPIKHRMFFICMKYNLKAFTHLLFKLNR